MTERSAKLYTIPPGEHFLKRLAQGLLEQTQGDLNALSKTRVLLPTRRAARSLRDSFIELNDGRPILLPRLQPLGDIDIDELDLTLSGLGLDVTNIPPAIKPLERQFLLAQMVRLRDKNLSYEQSLSLAKNLATLIDQVHTEGLDFSDLPNLVPHTEFSAHWQETLAFLEIVTGNWPLILEENGQVDPARRRALLMDELTKLWMQHPPETPVIAAGSTGSIPTTARLLDTIAKLPNGAVILPGLDLELEEESWQVIDDTHPQRTMKNLLDFIGIERENVRIWPPCTKNIPSPRIELIRAMMRPAETFGRDLPDYGSIEEFRQNVTICETANAREQAAVIATALRIILQDKKKTACFVTPDRALARRVTTALKRWGIEADDSAGQSLLTTHGGLLITLLLRVIEEDFAPVPLLEFLKHEFLSHHDFPLAVFETKILRGPRPASGLSGLEKRASTLDEPDQKTIRLIFGFLHELCEHLLPFRNGEHSPHKMLIAIIGAVENASGGAKNFWSRPESDSLSSFLSQLTHQSQKLPGMEWREWAGVLRTLLTQETYREIQPRHPRIVILGQLESRLIRHDVMILGGLNEGMWPAEPAHDPWMSRPMRKKFGLPPSGRSIGLSAHDFTESLAAPQVIITRALKEDGTETVPARWLQRLSTLLGAAGSSPDWTSNELLHWTRMLDAPTANYIKPEPPSPRPSQKYRPQQLSATWIEKWMNNPYHVYARKILHLRRMKPLEDDSVFADRGTLLHDVLEEFIRRTMDNLPDNAEKLFMEIAHAKLSALESLSPHWHYWWPRMEKIAKWVVKTERDWREQACPWQQECEGKITIFENSQNNRHFTLTAKADRIDRIKTGGAAIIDYKTGTPPSFIKVKTGLAPQLPLEALVLERGGYGPETETKAMSYWKIASSSKSVDLHGSKAVPFEELVSSAANGLLNLVTQFEDPTTPYIAIPPFGKKMYEDDKAYAHLARMAEWSVVGGDESPDTENGDDA